LGGLGGQPSVIGDLLDGKLDQGSRDDGGRPPTLE